MFEMFDKMQKETEKAFEEVQRSKENFWKGHEERKAILDESLDNLNKSLNFNFEINKEEKIETENSKKLDEIDKALDSLLASM